MKKDLIIKLCRRVVNNENLNVGDFEYCDGIDCYKDSCPFGKSFNCVLADPIRLEIAKKYLKDNGIKEENKMEKTFREVIADIKEGEVWENSHIRIYHVESNDNIVIEDREGDPRYRFTMISEVKFRLKRKEYSFNEAFKAYEEGKEIESCENGYKYLQNTFTYPGNEQWLCFRNSEQMFTTEAIRGKWYIND